MIPTKSPSRVGRYELLERVWQGRISTVYRGRDTLLDREAAVKIIAADLSDEDDGAPARFSQELKAAARLQHRNIVTVFEFDEHDGTPFVAMEFLSGRTLASAMTDGLSLTPEAALEVTIQICAGLAFAHAHGVTHRDLRPANVWLCPDGTVKILDIGISTVSTAGAIVFGVTPGNVSYLSPQQVSGGVVDERSDIFSAGVILHELLSGRHPFRGDSPTATMLNILHEEPGSVAEESGTIPPELRPIVERALNKDPVRRYQRAVDLAEDLKAIRLASAPPAEDWTYSAGDTILSRPDSYPVPAQPESATGRLTVPWLSRRNAFAGIGALLLIVAALFVWQRPSRGRGQAPAVAINERPETSPPVPPPAEQVVLEVTSDPPGAKIALDGIELDAVTPARLPIDPDRPPKLIRVVRQGFEPGELPVTEAVLASGSLSFSLAVADSPVTVTASGRYAFEVIEGRTVLSPSSESHEFTVKGRRTIRLRAANYFLDRAFTIDPRSGRSQSIQAPLLGMLTVRPTSQYEQCQVWIDGQLGDYFPFTNRRIVAGRHVLQLRCGDGPPLERPLDVAPGAEMTEIFR